MVARDLTSSDSALVAYTPFLVSASATLRSMTLLTLGPVFQISSFIGTPVQLNEHKRVRLKRNKPGYDLASLAAFVPLCRDQLKSVAVALGKSTGEEHSGSSLATRLTRVLTGYRFMRFESNGLSRLTALATSCMDGSSQRPWCSGARITGIRSCTSASNSFGVVVRIVHVSTACPSGPRQRSHRPANAKIPPSPTSKQKGCFRLA